MNKLPQTPGWYWFHDIFDSWGPAKVFWNYVRNGKEKEKVLSFFSFRSREYYPEFVDNTKPEQWGERIEDQDGN